MKNLTLGEFRVRTQFNPSNLDNVQQIKQKTAELINILDEIRSKLTDITPEDARLIDEAQTRYEDAAMWGVKAATI